MDAVQILTAFSEDGKLAEEVLSYLNAGTFDEWDTDLWSGVGELGFGESEFQIAAKSGLSLAKYHRQQTAKQEEGGSDDHQVRGQRDVGED